MKTVIPFIWILSESAPSAGTYFILTLRFLFQGRKFHMMKDCFCVFYSTCFFVLDYFCTLICYSACSSFSFSPLLKPAQRSVKNEIFLVSYTTQKICMLRTFSSSNNVILLWTPVVQKMILNTRNCFTDIFCRLCVVNIFII